MSAGLLGTLEAEVEVILRGWERLGLYISDSTGRQRKEQMVVLRGDKKDFVLTRLSGVGVCRFAGL